MKQIYYISSNYPEKRCIIGKCPEYQYVDIHSEQSLKTKFDRIIQLFHHKYSQLKGEKTLGVYTYLKRNGVIHTFNYCIKSKTPWICTFETVIPRTNLTRSRDWHTIDRTTYKAVKLLAKDNCLQCLALSNAAYQFQMNFLHSLKGVLSDKDIEKIMEKTSVLHPPQKQYCTLSEIQSKFQNADKKEFIFVGHDFFRKGGKELIDTLSELKRDYDFHLTVISRLEYNDYASQTTEQDQLQYLKILQESDWISYYKELDNEKVIQLCKEKHIGLLPTFHDTYGYSVLEMQACGCTIVTTDIRALPEINNSECGYICHLPHDEFGESYYSTSEERDSMKQQLKQELEKILKEILDTPMDALCTKALASAKRIDTYHSPEAYGNKIKEIIIS